MDSGEDALTTGDGVTLRLHWLRPHTPRGVVVIVHGLGEHMGRYEELEEWLVENQYACYGYDQRGHGRSTGVRTDVADFWDYVNDLDQISGAVSRHERRLPLFVFGHSMGSIVAILDSVQSQDNWRGLILSGIPVIARQSLPTWKILTSRLLGVLFPGFRVNSGFRPEQLSRDERVASAYLSDHLVEQTVTVRWVTQFLEASRYALENAHKITLPVLVLHGGSDDIANMAGSRRLFERLGSHDKTFNEYPSLLHELHHELQLDRAKVFDDIVRWLSMH